MTIASYLGVKPKATGATGGNNQLAGERIDQLWSRRGEGYATGTKATPAAVLHRHVRVRRGNDMHNGSRDPRSLKPVDTSDVSRSYPSRILPKLGLRHLFQADSVDDYNAYRGKQWYLQVGHEHIIKVDKDLSSHITEAMQGVKWQEDHLARTAFCYKFVIINVTIKNRGIDSFTLKLASKTEWTRFTTYKLGHLAMWLPTIKAFDLPHQELRKMRIRNGAEVGA